MALFKILRGPSSGLKDLPINDGWCYYTPDTGLFYIDYNGTRIPLNAKDAQTLSGASLAQTLNSEGLDKEILSAAAVDEIKNNLELLIAEKQEHITGTEGQVVVIGANGRPTAVDIVANNIEYDNSVSGLLSTSVQNAIDELATISVQPDWNQNDETAADYVKNRTHYEESSYTDYVLNMDGPEIVGFSMPEVGGTITVKINGIESAETVKTGTSGPLGNYTYIGNNDFDSLRAGGTGWCVVATSGATFGFANPDTTMSIGTSVIHKIDEKYLPDTLLPFKPAGKSYLTFSSLSSFTLEVKDSTKHWNGTLEYFAPDKTWTVWDGTTILSAVSDDGEYVLYLRGTGNTVITGNNPNYRWILTGSNVKCIGNIETLLDYATVESGEHPTMANYCYFHMFQSCTSLIQAPELPATTLVAYCYSYMFYNCTALTKAPDLPATTLAIQCYDSMFQNCTSLIQAPALPATTLANYCYFHMFYNCTGLTQAPALPATTMADYCYSYMFYGCTGLTQAPALPATTLANYCYSYMLSDCTSLTQAPALPATMLADSCYCDMFWNCTSLIQVPALPATTLATDCYSHMFCGCTSLKLSSTKTGEYTQEYRIPSSGDGVTAINALRDMFASTGGTFTGPLSINTIYYLSSDNMIVRETEVATLNGYVGSMIDAADSGEVYVQDTEPADAQDGAIWIDTSVNPEIYVGLPEVTAADNGKVLMVLGGQWQVTEMPEIEFDIDNEGNLFIS